MILRKQTEEHKKRKIKNREKSTEKILQQKEKVKQSKEMILQEYKQNLPTYMENKLNQMAEKISNMKQTEGLSAIQVNDLLRPQTLMGQSPKYTAEQLSIIFDYYRKTLVEVNKNFKYPPSKENFCAFAGMSTATYNQYLTGADEDKQEVMLMIDDYIRENMLTSAQLREVDNITTMFRGKTAHGLVEASSPVIIEHRHETTSNEIQARLEALKRGESLKTIELKKNKQGIYEEE